MAIDYYRAIRFMSAHSRSHESQEFWYITTMPDSRISQANPTNFILNFSSKSEDEAHAFSQKARVIANRKENRTLILNGSYPSRSQFALMRQSMPPNTQLGDIFLQGHGNQNEFMLAQGVSATPARLAEELMVSGGIAENLSHFIQQRMTAGRDDNLRFNISVKLRSCLTGRAEGADRDQYKYKDSKTYGHDLLKCIRQIVHDTLKSTTDPLPKKDVKNSSFQILISVKAPAGWCASLKNGQTVVYYTPSAATERSLDKAFARTYETIENKNSIPKDIQSYCLPDEEKSSKATIFYEKYAGQSVIISEKEPFPSK